MSELRSDCDWLVLHMAALFEEDAMGRLRSRREPGAPLPPRFFLGRTRHGNAWRFRFDEETECVRRLSRLAGRERALAAEERPPPAPPERIEPLRRCLAEATPLVAEWRGPAYRFPEQSASLGHWRELAGGTRPLVASDAGDLALLDQDFPDLAPVLPQRQPCRAVVEAGRIVSVCYVAAGHASVAAEAGVASQPAARGRGLAVRCTAAWALDVLELGGRPLYSTSWSNRASQSVARKLDLEFYAEDCHFS